jgi:hypothetical protein
MNPNVFCSIFPSSKWDFMYPIHQGLCELPIPMGYDYWHQIKAVMTKDGVGCGLLAEIPFREGPTIYWNRKQLQLCCISEGLNDVTELIVSLKVFHSKTNWQKLIFCLSFPQLISYQKPCRMEHKPFLTRSAMVKSPSEITINNLRPENAPWNHLGLTRPPGMKNGITHGQT